jgi:hypothetical protein
MEAETAVDVVESDATERNELDLFEVPGDSLDEPDPVFEVTEDLLRPPAVSGFVAVENPANVLSFFIG